MVFPGARDGDPRPASKRHGFPWWGGLAIPAGLLWGLALGAGAGLALGNIWIGAAIGSALGIGTGLCLFAAAVVIASSRS